MSFIVQRFRISSVGKYKKGFCLSIQILMIRQNPFVSVFFILINQVQEIFLRHASEVCRDFDIRQCFFNVLISVADPN